MNVGERLEIEEDLTDMSPGMLEVYSKVFQEAHSGRARWGLSLEVGTRRGGSALMFLMLIDKLYEQFKKPHLFTIDPYGFKPYVSGIPGLEEIPIYGDSDYLAAKRLLVDYPNHAHFKMCSTDFFMRMHHAAYWFPGEKPFTTSAQPGEFYLGEEKKMGNVSFCLLDGDHSAKTILAELALLWDPSTCWMNPDGVVCVDNANDDPKTFSAIDALYRAEFGPTHAVVRGLK